MRIESIKGREILDSRGNPTVEVEVRLRMRLSNCATMIRADTAERES